MTKVELAAKMSVSPQAVDNWIRQGCPGEKRGRTWNFDLYDVRQWYNANIINYRVDSGARMGKEEAMSKLADLALRLLPYVDFKALLEDLKTGRRREIPDAAAEFLEEI